MFVLKRVNPGARLEEELRALRESLEWTMEEAEKISGIKAHLIRALEAGRSEDLPDDVYAEQLVRRYVRALGGKEEYMLEKFREQLGSPRTQVVPWERFIRPIKPLYRELLSGTRLGALMGGAILCMFIVGYIVLQLSHITSAPPLLVFSPQDGSVLTSSLVRVQGKTDPEVQVTVNGSSVYTASDGSFSIAIDVTRGTTVIEVQAKRRYGKATTEARRVLFSP